MKLIPYQRDKAVAYAKEWALKRNPDYYNFDNIGGDCTNFVSQCIFAGTGIMNYNKDLGWYYNNINDRAPAWSSAQELRRFLLTNTGAGPVASLASIDGLEIGDIISLYNGNEYYHSLIVVNLSQDSPLVCAHTDNSYIRRLDTYYPKAFSLIHILGTNTY